MISPMRKPSRGQGARYNVAFAITGGVLWFPLDELAMHVCQQEPDHYGGYDTYRHCRFYNGTYVITRLLRAGIPGNRIVAYQFVNNEWIELERDEWGGPITVSADGDPVPLPVRPRMSRPAAPLGRD